MEFHVLFVSLFLITLSLAKSGDEIHLQWALCDRHPFIVLQKLNRGISDPYKQAPITYYDTEPPIHTRHGLMFRTKTNKGQPISSVKIHYKDDKSTDPDTTDCVWDRYGSNAFYTCERRSPMHGKALWSDEQVEFAEGYQSVAWENLVPFGPFQNPKWKMKIEGYKATFDDVAAGQLHLMEIEVKVPKSSSNETYWTITDQLERSNVTLCHRQEGKTLRLLRSMGYLNDARVESEIVLA